MLDGEYTEYPEKKLCKLCGKPESMHKRTYAFESLHCPVRFDPIGRPIEWSYHNFYKPKC